MQNKYAVHLNFGKIKRHWNLIHPPAIKRIKRKGKKNNRIATVISKSWITTTLVHWPQTGATNAFSSNEYLDSAPYVVSGKWSLIVLYHSNSIKSKKQGLLVRILKNKNFRFHI
jgi:DNA-binding HxlR family transcriptional regulator